MCIHNLLRKMFLFNGIIRYLGGLFAAQEGRIHVNILKIYVSDFELVVEKNVW